MNNEEFMLKQNEEKKGKLLRVLNAKLPEAAIEDLVKIVSALNLKRQYNIRIISKKEHLEHLAVEETVKRNESIDGIEWESSTVSSISVVLGNITPGKYVNVNGTEEYSEPVILDDKLYAFTKENRNLGYLDLSKPEYENFLYLYLAK